MGFVYREKCLQIYIYLFICLFTGRNVYRSIFICLFVCLQGGMFTDLYLFVCLQGEMFTDLYLFVYLFVYREECLQIYICLFVCLFTGRNVYRSIFKNKWPERNELFLPGRMAYVIDLEDDVAESDIPTTLIRSKADCVSLEATTTLT